MIHDQATLVTRKAKSYEGETREEQFARWEEMAREQVTGGLAPLAERLVARAQDPGEVVQFSPLDVIERAVAEVAKTRAHYSRSDIFMAISNALPGHLGLPPDDILPLLDGLTTAALDRAQRLGPAEDIDALPDELRLANGESVYARHGSTRYATPGRLAAERSLLAAAVERGAHRFTDDQVDDIAERFAGSAGSPRRACPSVRAATAPRSPTGGGPSPGSVTWSRPGHSRGTCAGSRATPPRRSPARPTE